MNLIRHFLHSLDYSDKDPEIAYQPDDKIVMSASSVFEKSEYLHDEDLAQ